MERGPAEICWGHVVLEREVCSLSGERAQGLWGHGQSLPMKLYGEHEGVVIRDVKSYLSSLKAADSSANF